MIVCIECGLFDLVMVSCDVVGRCMVLLALLLTLFGLSFRVGLGLVLLGLLCFGFRLHCA